MVQDYLRWLVTSTKTTWWHDSADPAELARAIGRGAVGATTNPFLVNAALAANREFWGREIQAVLAEAREPERRAEGLMRLVVTAAAKQLMPQYRPDGLTGYVCGQVNPMKAADREAMLAMARRFSRWSPNVTVKLPATAAGLDVLEECVAEGITCTMTVSYTVAQSLAAAQRHRKGAQRARTKGVEPGRCFSVIMIGRLDDYLRDIAADSRAAVSESDIRQAGLAVTKRAYSIYRQEGYEAVLIIAALRGTYHMTELAGGELIMSLFPPIQEMLISRDLAQEQRIEVPIPSDVIGRLLKMPEFMRAYEPEGMRPTEFMTYGVAQRTLSQFWESGWRLMENLQ
jgi:transaldolase